MTGSTDNGAPQAADLAFVAEWLAQQFLTAPDVERLEAMRSMQGQVALQWIGDLLDQRLVTQAICVELTGGVPADLSVMLQRRHAALFEGIFRQRSVPPYASVWDGTGRLFGPAVERMQHILRDLDVRVASDCKKPADHIALELVALAEALRQDRTQSIQALLAEMRGWTAGFTAALIRADGYGFYGHAAQLLTALLDKIAPSRPAAMTQDMAAAAAPI